MNNPNKLIQSYQTTTWLINKQADGLTHEESVVQLPFRSNCFNWVVGHILVSRDRALRLLEAEPVLTDAETAVYETGSEPVTYTAQAIPLERLLNAVTESHSRIEAALQAATKEQLSAIYNEEHQQSVGDRIRGLHWHESYHLGQLEILRQAAGKDDKVV